MSVWLGLSILAFVALGAFLVLRYAQSAVVSHDTVIRADTDTVEGLVRARRKLEAIKLYREQHGVSLAEARDAVQAIERGGAPRDPVAPIGDTDIEEKIRTGHTIEAIKLYRDKYGGGLKEAKDAVDAWRARLPRSDPPR